MLIWNVRVIAIVISGITGWFPVNIPISAWNQPSGNDREPDRDEVLPGTSGLHRVGGGLELSIKFAHHEDRERVIHAARGMGWSPVDLDIEQDDWESEGTVQANVTMVSQRMLQKLL